MKRLRLIPLLAAAVPLSVLAADPPAPGSPPINKEQPGAYVTPTHIAAAYSDNSIAADRKYKGRSFRMKATIASVGRDLDDRPYLGLMTNYPGVLIKAEIAGGQEDALALLHRMDVVTMICVGAGLDTARRTPIIECSSLERQPHQPTKYGPTIPNYKRDLGLMP